MWCAETHGVRTRYRQGTRCVACSLESTSRTGTNLPTRNAMSGTDIAKVRSPSRYDICYIMSSTDKGYQILRLCGTQLIYDVRYNDVDVLTWGTMLLPGTTNSSACFSCPPYQVRP
eukprot:3473586-Rhodomonas_salina.6